MKVVSNTSPLTNLAAIGQFRLLKSFFGEIHIAKGVWDELNSGGLARPGSRETEAADWVQIHRVADQPLVRALRRDLDRGESETIALAIELEADLVLIDEREGRHAAHRLGLTPLGVLGLLLRGKQLDLLGQVAPHLAALRQNGFYISESLYQRVLTAARE